MNGKLTVSQFLDRFKHVNMLISQLPNAKDSDTFMCEEIKKLFYLAIPVRWRTNFVNSGQSILETSMDNLRIYMVQQE